MSHVLLPGTPAELWQALRSHPEASVYAGGTDLLVQIRSGLMHPPSLICLDRLEELKGISQEENGAIRIGSCTTHTRILAEPLVRKDLPVLVQAIEGLGSPHPQHGHDRWQYLHGVTDGGYASSSLCPGRSSRINAGTQCAAYTIA